LRPSWPNSSSTAGYYGTDYQSALAGDGSATATFSFYLGADGEYQLGAWWTSNASRATDAPYAVYNNGVLLGTVSVNQRTNGGQFNTLGTYALAAGSEAVNTLDRLDVVAAGGEVSASGARDLHDALEFIGGLRIQHQARLIRAGEPADNFMSPDNLSDFERNHLKDAFSVVRTMQHVLGQRYQR